MISTSCNPCPFTERTKLFCRNLELLQMEIAIINVEGETTK